MKKTDKSLENTIVKVLTAVCEQSLKEIYGFQWLTHRVNYKDFPRSLTIICVLETQDQLSALLHSPQYEDLINTIIKQLSTAGIKLPNNPKKHIRLDSEEACNNEHAGHWKRRILTQ